MSRCCHVVQYSLLVLCVCPGRVHAVVVVMAWPGGSGSWRAANSRGAYVYFVGVVGCGGFALRRCDYACSETSRPLAEELSWYIVVTCVKWRLRGDTRPSLCVGLVAGGAGCGAVCGRTFSDRHGIAATADVVCEDSVYEVVCVESSWLSRYRGVDRLSQRVW